MRVGICRGFIRNQGCFGGAEFRPSTVVGTVNKAQLLSWWNVKWVLGAVQVSWNWTKAGGAIPPFWFSLILASPQTVAPSGFALVYEGLRSSEAPSRRLGPQPKARIRRSLASRDFVRAMAWDENLCLDIGFRRTFSLRAKSEIGGLAHPRCDFVTCPENPCRQIWRTLQCSHFWGTLAM